MPTVTLHKLARHLGVSHTTVSQILNNKGHLYRPETRERVLKAAAELGYRPNVSARATVMGRFNAIAVLYGYYKNRFLWPMLPAALHGVESEAADRGLRLSVGQCDDEQIRIGKAPKLVREWSVDGVLINYPSSPPQLEESLARVRLPAIWINDRRRTDCVYPDDYKDMRAGTARLIGLGHRHIAYLSFREPKPHYSAVDRYEGYAAAMREAGLSARPPMGDWTLPPAEQLGAATRWLAGVDRPTAVVTYSDGEAINVIAACLRLGLRVPQDLSIFSALGDPSPVIGVELSGVITGGEPLGQAGVRRLLERMDRPDQPLPPLGVRGKWVDGGSVAPPPAG